MLYPSENNPLNKYVTNNKMMVSPLPFNREALINLVSPSLHGLKRDSITNYSVNYSHKVMPSQEAQRIRLKSSLRPLVMPFLNA